MNTNFKRLPRFIIKLNGNELQRVESVQQIADYFGCTKVYVYNATRNDRLNYQGKTYEIIDILKVYNTMSNALNNEN